MYEIEIYEDKILNKNKYCTIFTKIAQFLCSIIARFIKQLE